MNIIRRGKVTIKEEFILLCNKCQSIFTYQHDDIDIIHMDCTHKFKEGDKTVECPVCTMTLKHSPKNNK